MTRCRKHTCAVPSKHTRLTQRVSTALDRSGLRVASSTPRERNSVDYRRLDAILGWATTSPIRLPLLPSELPIKSCIIDGEVVACRADGAPDFRALHGGNYAETDLCVWSFDLLELDGKDMRHMPLIVRRLQLGKLLRTFDHDALRYSEAFRDPERLLAECDRGHRLQRARIYHSERDAALLQAPGQQRTVRNQVALDQGQDRGLARGQPESG